MFFYILLVYYELFMTCDPWKELTIKKNGQVILKTGYLIRKIKIEAELGNYEKLFYVLHRQLIRLKSVLLMKYYVS